MRVYRGLNVDVAQVLLTNALKWRRMFKMLTTDKVMTPQHKSPYFSHFGHDKMGTPVMFVIAFDKCQSVLISVCRYIKFSKINWERFRIDKIGALAYVLLPLQSLLAVPPNDDYHSK